MSVERLKPYIAREPPAIVKGKVRFAEKDTVHIIPSIPGTRPLPPRQRRKQQTMNQPPVRRSSRIRERDSNPR